MKIFRWVALAALLLAALTAKAETVALKTNILGWAATAPNIGAELRLGSKSTVQVFGLLLPWGSDEKHLRIWNVEPEYRYWFCMPFSGHFLGLHLLGGEYNVKGRNVPFGILPKFEKEGQSYEGWYAGVGLTYGYQWMLSRHWNLEASIGAGYAYSPYKFYGRCGDCKEKKTKHYIGPTKVAVSLMYVF